MKDYAKFDDKIRNNNNNNYDYDWVVDVVVIASIFGLIAIACWYF